jgi:hypothetical protein
MEWFMADPSGYLATRWIFLRVLGVIYFIAFTSFSVQVVGLIGKNGILPARTFLDIAKKALGRKSYLYYPTLAWIHCSDTALKSLCLAGIILSILLALGLQTTLVLALLWLLYLSLVS